MDGESGNSEESGERPGLSVGGGARAKTGSPRSAGVNKAAHHGDQEHIDGSYSGFSSSSLDLYGATYPPDTPRQGDVNPGSTDIDRQTLVRPPSGLPPPPDDIFIQPLDVKYRCASGDHVLTEPYQSYCGHRFCRLCKEKLLSETPALCPKCQQEEDEEDSGFSAVTEETLFRDKAVEREIGKLDVKCPNDPCAWTGIFKKYANHLISECKHQTQPCAFGCEQKLSDKDIDSHNHNSVPIHLHLLLMMIIAIENLYKSLKPGSRNDKDEALQSRVGMIEEAIIKMGREVDALPRKRITTGEFKPHGQAIDKKELETLERKNKTTEDIVHVLDREVTTLIKDTEDSKHQLLLEKDIIDNLDNTIKRLEREMARRDLTIMEREQQILSLETLTYDGVMIWRIDDYSRKKREAARGAAQSIYSPPFYTSRNGFKMCARIYLNGDGMARNSHISLFVVVVRGKYDAILKWPFILKTTLQLLDQDGRESLIDAFRPDPTSSSFKRPTTDMNIASGCPMFAPHAKVENTNFGFLKDDTLFVKVKIDPE